MSLNKLPAKTTQQNVAVLEDLFLSANLTMKWLDSAYVGREGQIVDIAISMLAQYGNEVILSEVFEEEELEPDGRYDSLTIRALTEIYALWVNKAAIVARPDNLLTEPDLAKPHWKTLFDYEMTKLIVSKGKLMSYSRSFYGWLDYMTDVETLPKVVAVFNVKEDSWGEFAGTFATEHDSQTGFTCHVMYADGTFRDLRYEGTLAQVMKELG